MMLAIDVQCYDGYRAAQRPNRFTIRGRRFEVVAVDDQWYDPNAIYFRVVADDGNLYILRHDEIEDTWTLDAFRAGGR